MNAPLPTSATARLGMVELLDRDGGVAHRVPVLHWPVSIGRAVDCDVVLDDAHAAAHHALLLPADDGSAGATPTGAVLLQVGDTRNGLRHGGRLLTSGTRVALASGAEWQIGRTRLRLRLADETLPPEAPLSLQTPAHGGWIVAGLVLLVAWALGDRWLQSDPGDPLGGYLPALVGVPVALGLWSFVWALGSKLFARHFDFLAHLRFALAVLLTSIVLEAVLPLLAFSLSWEWLLRAVELVGLALGCVLFYGHLGLILPARRQALAIGLASLFVVGAGLKLALNEQREDRWFSTLYMTTLAPPALRLAPATTPEQFVGDARSLKATLDKHAREADTGNWLPQDDDD